MEEKERDLFLTALDRAETEDEFQQLWESKFPIHCLDEEDARQEEITMRKCIDRKIVSYR